jgi:predicted  nucleic acid-binding Zn-ribbon protein
MRQEVEALLALQDDDLKIREIESQIRELDPHLAELDRKRDSAAAALKRAQAAVEGEEKKQRELQQRLAQHRQLQERNVHQLDDVKRLREATAATAQVEATRRLMAEDESEIAILGRRINEMSAAVVTQTNPRQVRSHSWPPRSGTLSAAWRLMRELRHCCPAPAAQPDAEER